jgi:branched-chain amino acid transport system ATP-binding protein
VLEVRDLHASYGDLRALGGVTLTVGAGEIVALLGPNGAGKSTLLKSIAGLLRPRAGTIRWEGQDLAALGAHQIVERGLALVPEGRRLFGSMTVGENLELGAFAPRARAVQAQSLERVYALFPVLRDRRAQLVRALSGGQQQMVAVGRALMSAPRLLMLDEPSLGIAPLLVRDIFKTNAEINRAGTTVLLDEQNVHASLTLAHRGYVLEGGRGSARRRRPPPGRSARAPRVSRAADRARVRILAQQLILGLMLGGLYGLAAAGLSLVFGVLKVLNVAHGELIMLGGYAAFFVVALLGVDPFLSLLLVLPLSLLLGVVLYAGLFGFVVRAPEETRVKNSLLIGFGLALALHALAVRLWTADERSIITPYGGSVLRVGGLSIPLMRLLILALAFALIGAAPAADALALGQGHPRHRGGLGGRAAERHRRAARLSAGLRARHRAGWRRRHAGGDRLLGQPVDRLEWTLKALIVVVLAGLGSMIGTFVGGLVLGAAEALSAYTFGGPYREVVGLAIFVVVLVARPRGLFGR